MSEGNTYKRDGTYIGKMYNTHTAARGDHFWDGMIDDLRVYSKALSAQELQELQAFVPPLVQQQALTKEDTSESAPVFYLNFDDGTCKDSSGRGHDGTGHDVQPVSDGVRGKAMKLDGLEAYVSVDRSQDMTLGVNDDRSILLWWKADLIDEQTQALLSMRGPGDSQRGLSVDLFKAKYYRLHLRFYHHADFLAPLQAQQWNHLAVVKRGVDWSLYHNGVRLTDPVTVGWPFKDHANAQVPLWIGRDHASGNPFGGSIDEVMFFDRALSGAEVKQIYSSKGAIARIEQPALRKDVGTRQAKYPQEKELLGVWQLAEIKGDDPDSPLISPTEIGKLRLAFSKPPFASKRITCKWLPGATDDESRLQPQAFTVRLDGKGILRMTEIGGATSQPDLLFRAQQVGGRLLLNMFVESPDVWMHFEKVKSPVETTQQGK